MISNVRVGVIGVIGFVIIESVIGSGVLTGTDIGTTLVRTIVPLAFGAMVAISIFTGIGGKIGGTE